MSTRIDPMMQKSGKKPLTNDHPAVTSYMGDMVGHVKIESYQNRAIVTNFKLERWKGVRGEWVVWPACFAKTLRRLRDVLWPRSGVEELLSRDELVALMRTLC